MWGNGGRFYWGRKEKGGEGIVVVFAWLSSQETNLKPYIDLYGSLGWNSLICHVDFLTLFFPAKASSLACGVLSELVKEVKVRALPIVLTSFSGGSKGCLYKVIQLVEGKCEGQLSQELGGDVKLVKWASSPHYHQADYKAAVTEFLMKAAVIYSQRRQFSGKTAVEGSCSKVSESVCNLRTAAVSSNESLKRVAIEPCDHFLLPSSMDFSETKEAGSLPDEQKGDSSDLPSINPHGVRSQILFDVCVPKNIEGWDIKSSGSVDGRPTFSGRSHGQFNPIKYIRRSKL